MRINAKQLIIALVAVAIAAGLALSLTKKPAAPAVVFTTLSGKRIDLASLRGKIVLVNFWDTGCPGCIAEMPQLVKTYQTYHARGFELIAVAMSFDTPRFVKDYRSAHHLPFRVAFDATGKISRAFGNVQLTPTSFIIGKDGHLLQRTVGTLDFARLDQLLDRRLG
ncbi:MAG: TlpA disulfide reductase family protein [Betaproteobacteria bacterium]|nr:TlpA disulfide reductase family protein [Betaproteobacteria bacterium]